MLLTALEPHFQKQLADIVKDCEVFSVSFDKRLNKVIQKGQMDIIVRFWKEDQVSTRYLTSLFLGYATAKDLLVAFTTGIKENGLDMKKIIHVSMDGLNINLKFISDLKVYLEESPNEPEILDTGTCSLHIVNGAYKTSHDEINRRLHNFLAALYYLFRKVPARRADYTHFTKSTLFPLKFCSVRWLENSKVMERAKTMILHLKIYCSS